MKPVSRALKNLIKHRYGGKQGLVKHFGYKCWSHMGGFRDYRCIDWRRVKRVIFVCRGNICRSPYCEVKARQWGIAALSIGLQAKPGRAAQADAIRNAGLREINLQSHRAKAPHQVQMLDSDLLVAMEPWHADALSRLDSLSGAQITLLGLWGTSRRPYIQDPYGRSDAYFQRCFDVIDTSLESMLQRIQKNSSSGI